MEIQNINATFSNSSILVQPESTENPCLTRNHTSLHSFQVCVSEQASSQLRSYMSWTQVNIFTVLYVFISILGVLGNGLVIFVVVRRPEMRTTRNVFIVNLALSNFLLAIILVPFLWIPTYNIEFSYGSFMCKVAQAFPGTNSFCSTLTVSAIAVDRYFAVVRTRIAPEMKKTVQATLIAVAIWIISFSLSVLYLLHFDIKDYALPVEYVPRNIRVDPGLEHVLLFQRCQLQPQPCLELENPDDEILCISYYESVVSGIMAVSIYIVPMPILVIFNLLLTRFLAKNDRQQSVLRHRVNVPSVATAQASTPTHDSEGTVPVGTSLHTPPIPTNSNRSSSGRRRNRTTALLFAMAFSNAILWLPFTVISLIIQLGPAEMTFRMKDELRQLDDAAKMVSMLSICVNPFLYGYLNTNFQREFKSIFRHCLPCLSRGGSTKNAILLLPASQHLVPRSTREAESSVTVYVNGNHAVRTWTSS